MSEFIEVNFYFGIFVVEIPVNFWAYKFDFNSSVYKLINMKFVIFGLALFQLGYCTRILQDAPQQNEPANKSTQKTNASSGAKTNTSSGAKTNTSSGAKTNTSSGAKTNTSSGAKTNTSSGAKTNTNSGTKPTPNPPKPVPNPPKPGPKPTPSQQCMDQNKKLQPFGAAPPQLPQELDSQWFDQGNEEQNWVEESDGAQYDETEDNWDEENGQYTEEEYDNQDEEEGEPAQQQDQEAFYTGEQGGQQ